MTGELFLSRFTPSMMSADVLEKVFVQRGDIADRITEVVRESILTPSKHHTLVIGSRGIGKTHLLSLVHNRISRQEDLTARVRISWLREEEWGVASFLDLLYRILRALAAQYGDRKLEEQTEALFSLPLKTAERRAGDLLRKFIGDKTLLLIAENLDSVFAGLAKKGQQRLRAHLQQESSWTILGSSQALFTGVTLYESPFYGFFDIHHLQELTVEDAARLIRNIAELANDSELTAFVQSEAGRARIRAVHHLAGGNHRVYMILSEFLTRDSLDQLVDPFLRMMDDLTPYYQARMEQLSPQQRKIIDLLCSVRGAVSVKEVAKRCFITSQTASSQLKDLRHRGYVEVTAVGRDAYYELAEPLMRLALEVKNQRNGHVRLFLAFLRYWYARAELIDLLARTPSESVLERDYLQRVINDSDEVDSTSVSQQLYSQLRRLAMNNEWRKALPVAEKLVEDQGGVLEWTLLGHCLGALQRHSESLAAIDRALALDATFYPAWIGRALALPYVTNHQDALDAASEAIRLQSDRPEAHLLKAGSLRQMQRFDDAEQVYDQLIKRFPDSTSVWVERSSLLTEVGRYEEAKQSVERALAIEPDSPSGLIQHGILLNISGRHDDAAKVFDSVIAIDPQNATALQGHALALAALGEDEAALALAQQALALEPNQFLSNWLAARQLVNVGQFAAALPLIDKAESLGLSEDLVLNLRARGLLGVGRWEEGRSVLDRWLKFPLPETERFSMTSPFLQDLFHRSREDGGEESARVLLSSFHQQNLSGILAAALSTTATRIVDEGTSYETGLEWVRLWQAVTESDEQFGIALRILDTVLEYRQAGDPRILLRLPLEERRIVEDVLGRTGYSQQR